MEVTKSDIIKIVENAIFGAKIKLVIEPDNAEEITFLIKVEDFLKSLIREKVTED